MRERLIQAIPVHGLTGGLTIGTARAIESHGWLARSHHRGAA